MIAARRDAHLINCLQPLALSVLICICPAFLQWQKQWAAVAAQLQIIRFVQGLGGSIGMVIAIIKDQYHVPAIGKRMSMVLAILGLSPVAAPLIDDGLQALGSWCNILIFLAMYGAIVLSATAFFIVAGNT